MYENKNIKHQLVSPYRFAINCTIGPLIKKYCPHTNASILDIGCGKGYYGYFNKENIKGQYMGIDIKPQDTWDTTKSPLDGLGIYFKLHNAESVSNLDDEFNFICAFQSFEHIRDNDKVLAGMRKKLRNNGYILITIPSKYSFFLYGFHGYRRYSPLFLKELIKANNFTLENLIKIGGWGTFILHLVLWTIPSIIGRIPIWKFYELLGMSKCIYWLEYATMKLDKLFPIFESGYAVIIRKSSV